MQPRLLKEKLRLVLCKLVSSRLCVYWSGCCERGFVVVLDRTVDCVCVCVCVVVVVAEAVREAVVIGVEK